MPKHEKGSAEAKKWGEKMKKARDAKKMMGSSIRATTPILKPEETVWLSPPAKKTKMKGGFLQPGEMPIQQFEQDSGLNLEDILSPEDMATIQGGKVNLEKELKKVGKQISRATKPVSKATSKLDKAFQPSGKTTIQFSKAMDKVNPVGYAIRDPRLQSAMIKSGEISTDYLLPAIVQAGMPMYYGAAGTAGMMLGGPLGAAAAVQGARMLHDEMVGKPGYSPAQQQRSKSLGQFSTAVGKIGASNIKSDLKPEKEKKEKGEGLGSSRSQSYELTDIYNAPIKRIPKKTQESLLLDLIANPLASSRIRKLESEDRMKQNKKVHVETSGTGICKCCQRCKMCGMGLYA